jgi:hypothetical protein
MPTTCDFCGSSTNLVDVCNDCFQKERRAISIEIFDDIESHWTTLWSYRVNMKDWNDLKDKWIKRDGDG